MKLSSLLVGAILLIACSTKPEKTSEFSFNQLKKEPAKEDEPASTRIDLQNKGVGPITEITIGEEIDQTLANSGAILYQQKCTACHKIGEKFVGPAPNGILQRRSPEWVMNMILNPSVMLKEDELAKDLFMEFNGAPMANQGLTQEEARSILEYFRTLE